MNKMIIPLLCGLFLTSCTKPNTTTNEEIDIDKSSKSGNYAEFKISSDESKEKELDYYLWDYSEKVNYCKENYPDRTILTWLRDSYTMHEQELNDYLYENGYDYVICFKTLSFESEETYLQQLEDMSESNETFDILSSFGTVTGTDTVSNSYYYLAKEGYFEPLDDVITKDEYANYYGLMTEKYWDSYKFDGRIYGIDNNFSTLMPDYGYEISTDLYNGCGLAENDFFESLSECEKAFREIYDYSGMSMNITRTFDSSDIVLGNYLASSIMISDGSAVNVFENDTLLNYLVTLNDLSQKGYVTINSDSQVVFVGDLAVARATDYEETSDAETTQNTTKVYPKKSELIWNPTNANGVYSESQNKELAEDALIRVTFDSDINNIITFGTEGESFTVSGNTAVMNEGNTVDFSLNNPLVSYEYIGEDGEIKAKDYATAYEDAQLADGFGFLFDGTEIADTYKSVVNLTMSFNPENEDISAYIEDFNTQLYDAGMQDILDEANKQLEEWEEQKNET